MKVCWTRRCSLQQLNNAWNIEVKSVSANSPKTGFFDSFFPVDLFKTKCVKLLTSRLTSKWTSGNGRTSSHQSQPRVLLLDSKRMLKMKEMEFRSVSSAGWKTSAGSDQTTHDWDCDFGCNISFVCTKGLQVLTHCCCYFCPQKCLRANLTLHAPLHMNADNCTHQNAPRIVHLYKCIYFKVLFRPITSLLSRKHVCCTGSPEV